MSKTQAKGPPGLRMLSVMFTHPEACFLSDEHLKKARFLSLKFAKSFLVEKDGITMVKSVLYTTTGLRYSSGHMHYSGFDNALQLQLEAHLVDIYDDHTTQLIERLQQ
jgi:hypothetical protein